MGHYSISVHHAKFTVIHSVKIISLIFWSLFTVPWAHLSYHISNVLSIPINSISGIKKLGILCFNIIITQLLGNIYLIISIPGYLEFLQFLQKETSYIHDLHYYERVKYNKVNNSLTYSTIYHTAKQSCSHELISN